jgi:hypothetical protein
MKALRRSVILGVSILAILAGAVQEASADAVPGKSLLLFGTTGACNSVVQGGPCTTLSTLVQLDPQTGALIKEIGPVGYTVNGLAWDSTSRKLYASTASGDVNFHGLITINPHTGRGIPVKKNVVNFGLPGTPSPIHSITIDSSGNMAGWYDESPPPDTFVRIDKKTGVATEFPGTGINTSQNGLSFDVSNYLWNIDSPRLQNNVLTQTLYLIDPVDGKSLFSKVLTPVTAAALGDFNPEDNLYYGLNFDTAAPPPFPTSIVVVNPRDGTVTPFGPTVDDLHTLAFVPKK